MPELPEVEILRRQLNKEVVGKRIERVSFDIAKMLKPSPKEFLAAVEGKKINQVGRRAKLLFFHLGDGTIFAVHLKLSGRLLYRKESDPADDYNHITLHFKEGSELRFAEARKFGFMQALKDEKEYEKLWNQYGPEPLSDLTQEKFVEILKNNSRRIKDLLMDQKTIAGVGNIYVNEALWLAGIHPETPTHRISRKGAELLFRALEKVLKEALVAGGASDQWYRQLHGEKGHYQERFKVYGRDGEPCLRHPKSQIEYLKTSQRGTFVCPKCQAVLQ